MKTQAKDITDIENNDQSEVFGLLSEHLNVTSPSQTLLDSLGKRLENRIQTSIAKHAGLRTVRSREGVWLDLMPGIRYKPLWESLQGNSVLVEFAPGSALPLHRHSYLEEGIVLSGGLQLDDLELTQFDYHVSPAGSRHGRIRSKQGALAYLRGSSVGQPLSMFKEVLGGLLPKNHKESESITAGEGEWIEIQTGVFQKDLWTDGTVASRFFRLNAGTYMDRHYHPLEEECMMLSGDIFLGDILVQEGDYHVAPAGTEHLEMFSDTGALLYVRGAV
ncbi:cupin domain-containing protein [Methyloglobulus morosus]|nr:cupin domain-containing protein [Methyloglobulus morosus]